MPALYIIIILYLYQKQRRVIGIYLFFKVFFLNILHLSLYNFQFFLFCFIKAATLNYPPCEFIQRANVSPTKYIIIFLAYTPYNIHIIQTHTQAYFGAIQADNLSRVFFFQVDGFN